jgi:glycosyltransferase involved in cell wall biosynthesis
MVSREQPDSKNTMIQIPTPGDHYSPATGSAIITVIYEFSRPHAECGGQTQIIVGKGTRHDYSIGTCTEVDFPPLRNNKQKLIDAALGKVALGRPFVRNLYGPARDVIDARFDGSVIIHNEPAAMGLIKAKSRNAQVCLHAHNTLFGTYSRSEIWRTIGPADTLLCVSNYIAEEMTVRMGRSSEKIRVVINGVDTERFRPPAQPPDPEVPVVLFLACVRATMGPDLLVRAAAKIRSPKRRFKIRIVGSTGFSASDPLSPYEIEVRKLAEPLGELVEFHPFVDRDGVIREYQSASIFCLPSVWNDPCPLVIPEALASGLPTIASNRGGIPEEGGDAILYFQPPDVDQLAEHLAYLIDDEKARREWGARARARAEAISWEMQYQKLRAALAR